MIGKLAIVGVTVVVMASLAHAGATTPTLAIGSAVVTTSSGGRTAAFEAAFDYANAVQADYDLELIVFQGQRFARYPVSGAPRTGESAVLNDGLGLSDLPTLDAAGMPAPAGVRLLSFDPAGVTIVLPATFVAGSATAALAATVDEGPVLSNPLTFTVP